MQSGEYDRIVGGSYRRRDEKVAASAEAESAFRHYQQRFQRIFDEANETFGKVPERMADWLQQMRGARGTATSAPRSRTARS